MEYKTPEEIKQQHLLRALQSKICETAASPIPPENSASIVETSYSNLLSLIDSNSLEVGQRYLITDYRTVHVIPNTTDINTGPIEPLIVTALTINSIHSIAYSTLHPEDIVYYRVGTDETSFPGATHGYITRRIDTIQNNDVTTDWRYVKYRRYKIEHLVPWSATTTYSKYKIVNRPTGNANQQRELYVSLTNDNLNNPVTNKSFWRRFEWNNNDYAALTSGGWGLCFTWDTEEYLVNINTTTDYQDYVLFADDYTGDVFNNKINSYGFLNTVFNGGANYNFIDGTFTNNSLNHNFSNNTIKGNFVTNSIGTSFYNNIIHHEFSGNSIASGFGHNQVYCQFNTNSVGLNFQGNILNASFTINSIGNSFYSNILVGFSENSVINNFSRNKLTSFNGNIVKSVFTDNTINIQFTLNTINSVFQSNFIATSMFYCTFEGAFQENTVGNKEYDSLTIPSMVGTTNLIRKYKALLSQSGTSAPVSTVLENTLGGTPVFNYIGNGHFTTEGTNLFTGTVVAKILPTYITGLSPNSTIKNDFDNTGNVTINSFIVNGTELITSPLNVFNDYGFGPDAETFSNLLENYCDSNGLKSTFTPNDFANSIGLAIILGANTVSYNGILQNMLLLQLNGCSVLKVNNNSLNIFTASSFFLNGQYNEGVLRNNLLFNSELIIEVYL